MTEENDNMTQVTNDGTIDMMTDDEQVEQEIAQKNTNDYLKTAVESIREMCKELLEKQKNQENSNLEIAEKFRASDEKIDELSKKHQENFDSIQLKMNENNEKSTAKSPEIEHPINADSSEKSLETNTFSPKTVKNFALKHTFEYVPSLDDNEKCYSNEEEHFGVTWKTFLKIEDSQLMIYLQCMKSMEDKGWNISTKFSFEMISKNGKRHVEVRNTEFGNLLGTTGNIFGPITLPLEWTEIDEDYIDDDSLVFEVYVGIDDMVGVYKENLRDFGEAMKVFSDVVLTVGYKMFYVAKLYLAAQSPYFNSLLLGQFQESKKSEIKLTGIDADDFQNFLEVLYGEPAIDETTIEGILIVADMYDTPLVTRKCEDFLMKESKKTPKKKLQMSIKYHLNALKKQCLDGIYSVAQVEAILPGSLLDLETPVLAELLQKSISWYHSEIDDKTT